MKYIKLTKGYVAKVDDDDFEYLNRHKWRATFSGSGAGPYAVRCGKKSEGILWKKKIYMHRAILQPPGHMVVDHLNNDGLDNRRINLEVTTTKENNLRNIAFTMQSRWGKGPPPGPLEKEEE